MNFDIALMEDTINKAEAFFHKVEIATQTIGLFLNASKTKVMHLNPTANIIRSLNGYEIEKVDDFSILVVILIQHVTSKLPKRGEP